MSTGKNLMIKILQDRRTQEFVRLNSEALYQEEELDLYAYVKGHHDEYGTLPLWDTVKKKMKLKSVPEEPFQYYWDEYINRYMYNEMGDFLPALTQKLINEKPASVAQELEEFMMKIKTTQAEASNDVRQMYDIIDEVIDSVEDTRMSDGITGVTTGWPKLDEITNGFQGGDVYVILARPKLGKSLVIARMADEAHKAGYIPVLVSMEMRAKQMARRFIAMRAEVNMNFLKTGQMSTVAVRHLRNTANLMREQQPFYYVEGQFKKTVQGLQALVHAVKPDIVFVDGGYLLQLQGVNARLQKWEKITEIAEMLKTMSIQQDIPVVVSFQFNRQVKKGDKAAGYEKIQLSDAISQLASVGIGIFDDDEDSMYAGKNKRLEIIGEGGREGESGGFWINWDWNSMNFSEMAKDTITDSIL